MKKVVSLILLFVCISALAFSCSRAKDVNNPLEFSFDKDGHYLGFSDLPSDYTFEKAKNDGYFVRQDLDIAANENVWNEFVQASLQKENSSIRIVQFFTEGSAGPYYLDLFYENGYYYLFDSSSRNNVKRQYLYLLILDGKYGIPLRDSGVIILTDDDTLTFDTVMSVLASSSRFYKMSVSPFKIVMFK